MKKTSLTLKGSFLIISIALILAFSSNIMYQDDLNDCKTIMNTSEYPAIDLADAGCLEQRIFVNLLEDEY